MTFDIYGKYLPKPLVLSAAEGGVSKDAFREGTAVLVNAARKTSARRRFYETILRDDFSAKNPSGRAA